MRRYFAFCIIMLLAVSVQAVERQKLNFNADWRLCVGDYPEAVKASFDDSQWQRVTLPYAFNGDEAFRKDIVDLTDTICWYRKKFTVQSSQFKVPLLSPEEEEASPRGGLEGAKFFIEFEGVRQGADVYLNGHHVGFSENGVMAFGFDLTPYIKEGENVLAVRCDNSWTYRSRRHDSRYQWNDKNFNANYGGIPKNVWLHVTGKLYQTLPLYSDLGTTGTYVYATDFDIPHRKAVIHAESEVRNEDTQARTFIYSVQMLDADGKEVALFHGDPITMQPGETRTVKTEQLVEGLHFWSWGYGYLYTVKTSLLEGSVCCDYVATRTGFRKTRFAEGKIWLNDRCLMVHGYAQRTSNEWPGVGISVPAWLSDYSNGLMVESGANLVRWMHVTPWKQDIESCDRVGLIQAMPAGDAEKDVEGPRWAQRTELMRDAIIYNRNNPSILFYESGNESISREHMLEMKAIRDEYDPYGGRAIGSREMLDIDEAEYGGEMLYINKSKKHPMWAMEYCRDEGLRKYWNEWSYPYHKEGDGPLYRGKPAPDYNHNMDHLAIEMVRRWYDYWCVRPGTGTRVSSGGVKIVFSDTNTHHRGEKHYRTSGVVDAMRIPKDAFYAHQVMWSGWVEPEEEKTYIIGHWNIAPLSSPEGDTIEAPSGAVGRTPVYVVSTGDEVELFLNGRSLGKGKQSYRYLFTFDDVPFEPGTLEAVANDGSRYKLETVGEPYQLKLTAIENPEGTKADGADMVLFQVEVLDKQGRRCPVDDRMIHFELSGEAKWIGGIETDAMSLPVECGVNRVLVRTTTNAGEIHLSAYAEGVKPSYIKVETRAVANSTLYTLNSTLSRGETPLTPSFTETARSVKIVSAKAGYDTEHASRSYDDNELSEWKNDGRLSTAWITYELAEPAAIDEISLKLTGWRQRSYPLEVLADNKVVWRGNTEKSLGYVSLFIDKPVKARRYTIRQTGSATDKDAFGQVTELAGGPATELDLYKSPGSEKVKGELRIVEADFLIHVSAADVAWFDGTNPVSYQVEGKTDPVVQQALRMFCDDMELVTGHRAVASKNAAIRIVQGRGNDDGFRLSVKDGQIVVEGHNARGTAYGLLELSRMAGVSPWVWWGDVRPHTRSYPLSLPDTFCIEHTPSVAYRGIFINDEDWSLRRWSKDNMGPQTYKRLFELMLRLRANTLWPAMHEGTPGFFTVKGNKEMADSFGIVIGSSHCEPLLRNNVAEWNHASRGPYNYITNRKQVQRYWAERLKEVAPNSSQSTVHSSQFTVHSSQSTVHSSQFIVHSSQSSMFTLGMRGIHDGSMEGVKTPEEKLRGLQQVIDDQRQLIRKYYHKDVENVPQVFIPYKEVLEIMENGLLVPDDVTLMWCDDNYGYLTRLPDAKQQERRGGGGVYYHLSYWGRPHDYLWLTTTQPGLIYSEMKTAYDHNCRRLWIANVHDPKVAAYDLELFLDLAWDIESITPSPLTSHPSPLTSHPSPLTTLEQHLENWLCTQFGALVGKAIAPAMREWYRLNAIRKPEFMGWTQVELDKKKYPGGKSVPDKTEFTLKEAYERMEAFSRIEATVDTWRPLVMEGRQDAYFAHVLYPVHAAAAMTRKMLSNEEESRRAYEDIQRLTERYNTMNGGKWDGLMSAAPRDLPVFGQVRTSLPQHPSVGHCIARNACDYHSATEGVQAVQMLGHSMQAVALSKGNTLTYEFDSPQKGDAVLYTAMIPTQPSDRSDLRYTMSIDGQCDTISLKTPYRSERWKQSVLRGQVLTKTKVHLTKGPHKLYIKALDDHVIVDQWMLDFCPDHQFYVIPHSLCLP